MKNIYLPFFFFAFLVWTGCNDNENDTEENDFIKLSETTLTTSTYRSYTLEILDGSGEYSCEIDDKDIASVNIRVKEEKYYLYIITREKGDALITVTDEISGKTATCLLTVEKSQLTIYVRYGIDADMPELIETHLLESNPLPEGTIIDFPNSITDIFPCILTFPGETEAVNATIYRESMNQSDIPPIYSEMNLIKNWIASCMKWTLLLDDREINYDCLIIQGNGTGIGIELYDLCLYEDLTTYYQTHFPDANVKGVVRVLDLILQ